MFPSTCNWKKLFGVCHDTAEFSIRMTSSKGPTDVPPQ